MELPFKWIEGRIFQDIIPRDNANAIIKHIYTDFTLTLKYVVITYIL